MKLRYQKFKEPYSLCDWINENDDSVTIHSICNDKFGEFILFYSSVNDAVIQGEPLFDQEEFLFNRQQRGGRSGE